MINEIEKLEKRIERYSKKIEKLHSSVLNSKRFYNLDRYNKREVIGYGK